MEEQFYEFLQKNNIKEVHASGAFNFVSVCRGIVKVDTNDFEVLYELGQMFPYCIIVGKDIAVPNLLCIYKDGKRLCFTDILHDLIEKYNVTGLYGEDMYALQRTWKGVLYIEGTTDVNAIYDFFSLFYDYSTDFQVKFLSLHKDTQLVKLWEGSVA